ncbi:VP3 [Glis glis polyomavirus 1]|nr:VP3 [Glis glis polyomavirus 1]AWD33760.1 VP3 [Glis glis polyomavirus 1]
MALAPYNPDIDYDILFPGVSWFARNIRYFDPTFWTTRLWQRFVEGLQREAVRQIAHETNALGARAREQAALTLREAVARVVENTQWVFTNLGQGASNLYASVERYYAELPGLNPAQRRALMERLPREDIVVPQQDSLPQSGDFVVRYEAPGGANQRSCPNWLLPLILGIYDTTWGEPVSKHATKRKSSAEDTGPKTNCKRKRGSPGSKNRA